MSKHDDHQGFQCVNCNQAMEQLNPFVDRELNEIEMVEVRRHLSDCPPCEQHFVFQEKLKLLVYRNACPEKAPTELLTRILERLR